MQTVETIPLPIDRKNPFYAKIDYAGANGEREIIDGLFKTYIWAATEKSNKSWVRAAFNDTVGIIRLDEETDIVIKVKRRSAENVQDEGSQHQLIAKWQTPIPDDNPARDLMPTQAALLKLLQSLSAHDQVNDFELTTRLLVNPKSKIQSPKSKRDFRLTNGNTPTYGKLDPYAMAWASIDEAIRKGVAIGVNPDEVAIVADFRWGEMLGALVRCVQGCHDAAVAYRTPIINFKDAYAEEQQVALNTAAIGIVPDVTKTVAMSLQGVGNKLFVIGDTRAEMGGSEYAKLHHETGGTTPQPVTEGLARYRALHRALRSGLVESCHALSKGGLGVTLAEMAGRLGARIDLRGMVANVAHDDILLFSESLGRFLIEVKPENVQPLQFQLAAEPLGQVGTVTEEPTLIVNGYDGGEIVNVSVTALQ